MLVASKNGGELEERKLWAQCFKFSAQGQSKEPKASMTVLKEPLISETTFKITEN